MAYKFKSLDRADSLRNSSNYFASPEKYRAYN